jgi:hypothetical protein
VRRSRPAFTVHQWVVWWIVRRLAASQTALVTEKASTREANATTPKLRGEAPIGLA